MELIKAILIRMAPLIILTESIDFIIMLNEFERLRPSTMPSFHSGKSRVLRVQIKITKR